MRVAQMFFLASAHMSLGPIVCCKSVNWKLYYPNYFQNLYLGMKTGTLLHEIIKVCDIFLIRV